MSPAHRRGYLGTAVDCDRFYGYKRNFGRLEELKTWFSGHSGYQQQRNYDNDDEGRRAMKVEEGRGGTQASCPQAGHVVLDSTETCNLLFGVYSCFTPYFRCFPVLLRYMTATVIY